MYFPEDDELIVCRECGNKTATVITVDEIPCSCGNVVKVKYISCTCGYSYRMAGDIFLDGNKIDIQQVGNMLDDINEFFKEHNIFEDGFGNDIDDKPMSSFIHKCLRCEELAVEIAPNKYECTVCGFTWETTDAN